MIKPTFDEEKIQWQKGLKYIAGVDEVGRGCFAGPVVAAAVILPQKFPGMLEINDSKKLSANRRKIISKLIEKFAIAYSTSEVSVEIINKHGIAKAAQRAFKSAVEKLVIKPDFILIDAFYIENMNRKNQKAIVYGDTLSISIAAASIIAKVYRDDLMQKLHEKYVKYDFWTNKGYGTKKHRDAIYKYGLSDLHRKSFNLSKYIRMQD